MPAQTPLTRPKLQDVLFVGKATRRATEVALYIKMSEFDSTPDPSLQELVWSSWLGSHVAMAYVAREHLNKLTSR